MRPTTDYSYPVVRSLAPVQDRLQAADAAAPNVLLTDVGQVSTPGFEALFWRVVYRPFQPDLKRVLVIAGVNGNGAAGVEYTLTLVQELAVPPGRRHSMTRTSCLWPTHGPGSTASAPAKRGRHRLGLRAFASHESRIIKRFLREKRYDLVIDLREDLEATGFCIWQYGLDSTAVSERIVGELRAKGYPIEADVRRLMLKPRDGIITAPMWGLTLMRLFDRLTLSGYIRQNISYVVYSVVTPTVLPLADRVAMQRIAVERLISEYLVAPGPPPPARPGS